MAEGFYLLPDFRVVGFREPTRQGIHCWRLELRTR